MRNLLKEFKEFVMRGNVLDMAVGIVIGIAFGKIITSLVKDIIMPPVGLLLGGVDFNNLFVNLSGTVYSSLEAAKAAGAPTINYGVFINVLIDFIIVAFIIFLVVRMVNRMQRKKEPEPEEPTTKECPFCITEIPLKAIRCPSCTSDLT